MYEVEKWLKFVTLNGSWSMDEETLIIKWEYWSGLQVRTTEGNLI